jgi:hypothetical protein
MLASASRITGIQIARYCQMALRAAQCGNAASRVCRAIFRGVLGTGGVLRLQASVSNTDACQVCELEDIGRPQGRGVVKSKSN